MYNSPSLVNLSDRFHCKYEQMSACVLLIDSQIYNRFSDVVILPEMNILAKCSLFYILFVLNFIVTRLTLIRK